MAMLTSLYAERDALVALNAELLKEARLKDEIAAEANRGEALPLAKVPDASVIKPTGYDGVVETRKYDAAGHNANLANAMESAANDPMKQAIENANQAELATARAKAALEDFGSVANPIGQAFGEMFASVGKGATDIAGIWKNAAKQIAQVLYQMAVKSITAHATGAAAGAAESQSAIPVIGPGLAIAAMGAMFAMVTGLLGNLSSAAGGFDIPGTVNPLVQAHAKEMILPAKYAEGFRQMINSGRTGGLTIAVSAMDAKSFESALRDNDSSLIRVLSELASDRRF
jgi:hypothetical protein